MAHIAYFLGRFPVLSETFIGQEIRTMEALGHRILPIALHRPTDTFQQEDEELASRCFYFSPIKAEEAQKLLSEYESRLPRLAPFATEQTAEPYASLAAHGAQMADYLSQKGCTHIHAHFGWGAAAYAISTAKLLGVSVTFTCHGSDVYARPQDLAAKCKAADAVIAVAPSLAATLQALVPSTPCHVLPCGVDMETFSPLADSAQKHDRWLFVGRLIDCKGVDDILKAWERMQKETRPHLDIIGDGPLKEPLSLYANGHGLADCVHFLGAQPSSWIAQNAPSYRGIVTAFREGDDGSKDTGPLVLKEAMAMGLPVVSTDFMDIPAIVDETCGMLCPVSTPEAIAKAVMHIHSLPPEALKAMGEAGRAKVAMHYSAEAQAEKLTAIFNSLERMRGIA